MVIVIRKDKVIYGNPKYRAVFETPNSKKVRTLVTGNEYSFGDAREDEYRSNGKRSDGNKVRNSFWSGMLGLLVKKSAQKVVDKKQARTYPL
jgi:hypothetical protein